MDRPTSANRDRDIECHEALEDRLFALMNEAAEAGWKDPEVADAVQDLTLAWRRWRREKRASEARIAAAARRR